MILTLSIFTIAQSNDLGFNIGLNSINNNDKISLKNKRVGLTYQYNTLQSPIKPRIDFDYVDVSEYDDIVSELFKTSLNGVYEIDASEHLKPYFIGGVGYEVVKESIEDVFESQAFIQGGMGLSYHFNNDIKLNIEAKGLKVLTGKGQADELIVSMGISIPLSRSHGDVDTCSKKISGPDEDRDGITDSIDQCPDTPCGFTVNTQGCPIKAILKINFAVNSADITPYSAEKVESFVAFLNKNANAKVKIEGHTDSDGLVTSNQILSQQRAQSVVSALVDLGIDASRLSARGFGESRPIASNASKDGKQQNRRIVAKISYPSAK